MNKVKMRASGRTLRCLLFSPKRTKACKNPCSMGLFARFSLFRDKE
nr:MAG TPA: hypothetical protein [Caudoviricetes sp.]